MKNKINIAVVGLGQIGNYLLNELNTKKNDIELKTGKKIHIVAISAKNINKKRKFKINKSIFFKNPLDIIKIWQGGMSFHGALIGIIIGTFFFSYRRDKNALFFLDIISFFSPIGIFFALFQIFSIGD